MPTSKSPKQPPDKTWTRRRKLVLDVSTTAKQPPDKKVQVTKHTRRSITDSKNAKKLLRHDKVKEVYCKCGGTCNDKHCPCQKDNLSCGDGCRCSSDKCTNRIKRPDIRGFFLRDAAELEQMKLEYEHAKEVLDTLNSLVACDAAVSTTEEETLITFTGFCWRCHSTEHKESKCPNANDDKYDGNYEKNRMRYHELKAIEMKKEKKCSRCNTKEKLSGFFLRDWYKDESECVCKACRKLEVKVCNMCNTWKKRHSFKEEEWDLNDESPCICKHCFKIIGGRFDEKERGILGSCYYLPSK